MKRSLLLSVAAGFMCFAALHSQNKTLSTDDYKQWQRLSNNTLSDDGAFISYRLVPVEGNDTLFIKSVVTDSIYKEAFGLNLQFSPDSKYAVYLISVSQKEREKMEESKKTVHYKLAILHLATGEKQVFKEVNRFSFPEKGSFLLMYTYKPEGSKAKGSDIVLMDLNTKKMRTIGNVTTSSFNKKGDFLAYIIEPANPIGNGVELLDLIAQTIKVLDSDTATFSNLTWHRDGESIAFMKQVKSPKFEEENQEIIAYNHLYKAPSRHTFHPVDADGFPTNMRIAESRLQWSEDQTALFFGITEWTPKIEKSAKKGKEAKEEEQDDSTKSVVDKKPVVKKDEKLPGVDIWHWKDPEIQPRQKLTYNQDKNRSYLSMWDINNNRFIQIADSVYESASLSGNQKFAYISTDKPYEPQFRLSYADYMMMDLSTGKTIPFLTHHTGYISSSPNGKYLLYFLNNNWWTFDLVLGLHRNLTESQDVPFWNIRDDHPAEVRPAFGSGGWMKDDKYVLLYDEYDVWAFKPDGSEATCLTQGRSKEIIYRVTRIDREEPFLDPKDPMYFSMTGDKTKQSGFASMKWGKIPETLVYQDFAIRSLQKAKNRDQFIYSRETYVQSPQLILAGAGLSNPVVAAESNLQQKDYAWGRAELINFTNKNGKELQGALHYPANYEPGKTYPMVVYIYEIRSTALHSYVLPSDQSSYNLTNYVQQGFFVFQPDIIYRTDDPGISAVECVVPAVEKVLESGMVDRKKIGLMGHSWGAYQTAFIITQTDLFSAAVAGAPLTDMISMYTEVYWNSGNPNQGIFETSQGRFSGPYWEIMDKYIANSPMFNAGNITTPLLVAFGDKDGAVDWHQGIEMYTTMRRMEKPFVMLVYADENHGLRKKENMLDYTRKVNEWFNHFLLGQDPSAWIIEGVPYLDKMKLEEKSKKK